MIMKKNFFAITALVTLVGCGTVTQLETQSDSTNFIGTFSDNCASPTSSFTFNPGGKGVISSRGGQYNFTWTQKGRSAFAYVSSEATGKPSQTYTLNRTNSGIYLAAISANGQLADLTSLKAHERTKTKCR